MYFLLKHGSYVSWNKHWYSIFIRQDSDHTDNTWQNAKHFGMKQQKVTFHINTLSLKCLCIIIQHLRQNKLSSIKPKAPKSTDSEGIIVRLLTNCSFDVTTDKCLWNIFTVSFPPLSFCEVMILWFKLHRTILRTNIRKEWGITDEIQERPCLKCFNVVISRTQVHYFIILRKWALLSWDNEKINLLPQENKRLCPLIT